MSFEHCNKPYMLQLFSFFSHFTFTSIKLNNKILHHRALCKKLMHMLEHLVFQHSTVLCFVLQMFVQD